VPAVAVALRLDDADLLELLQAPAAATGFCVVLTQAVDVAERVLVRILDVGVVDLKLMQQGSVGALRVRLVLLPEVGAAAEVFSCAADTRTFTSSSMFARCIRSP